MVVPLGPGKFYGSSLPRPRIYTDIKFNPERVDPPVPILDPLLSWADEAHWSMGGLSFKRLRLQGSIEGNIKRLKAQREKLLKDNPEKDPVAVKKRKLLDLNDDDDVESEKEVDEMMVKKEKKRMLRKGAVRKLGDDFEQAAKNSGMVSKREGSSSDGIGSDVKKIVEEVNVESEIKGDKKKKKGKTEVQSGTKTSPRLAKRGCS